MSKKVLKIETPTVDETSDNLGKLDLNASNTAWDSLSKLKADQIDDKRGSFLSVFSEDSRRQSLFADEDQDKAESDTSSDHEDDEKNKRQDEVFVDKTRAAMVVIGAKDIKEALERKKLVEIFRKTPEAKYANVLFQQARFLMHQSRFKEAIVFLNRALTVDEGHKEWLTEKSRCYLSLLQPDLALQFIDQVLKQDPKYFRALILKGEILYSLWDLEKAMLCFVEGRRLRPDSTECIQGMHKVRMALQELAAYRFPDSNRKRKRSKKRSKSAKDRLTTSPHSEECFLTPNRDQSLSSRRPSSRLTTLSFISHLDSPRSSVAKPQSANIARGRADSHSISPSYKSDMRTSPEIMLSPKFESRGQSTRPKTAAAPRRTRSRSEKSVSTGQPDVDEIRKFVRESMSSSFKSGPLRCLDDGSSKSSRRSSVNQSCSSSMEDVSANVECGLSERPRLPRLKSKTKSSSGIRRKDKITPETRVSASLAQDKLFLNSLLKDKNMKRSQTAHTKRVLKIAREVHHFVSEREQYWRNRESFVRYATADEDTLI